jgi:rubrerythrin
MPEFANPFSGLAASRKVTHEELVRAIRYMVAAEYEAVQLYMQLAESTDNRLAQEVLKDIADEEIVHAGEFLRLLKELAPTEAAFYAEGEAEVEEMMAALSGQGQTTDSSAASASPGAEEPAESPEETEPVQTIEETEPPSASETEAEAEEIPPPPGVGNLFEKE